MSYQLPPLPPFSGAGPYSHDEMSAYGLAAYLSGVEAAAKLCDGLERRKWETVRDGGTLTGSSARDCAAGIRALAADGLVERKG